MGERRFEAVPARHALWAPPDPAGALRHGREPARPGGRCVLGEGVWRTPAPAGVPAGRLTALREPLVRRVRVARLSGHRVLWGTEAGDERYAAATV